jgi:hypothetical protein
VSRLWLTGPSLLFGVAIVGVGVAVGRPFRALLGTAGGALNR